jgi:hypothetical protein
MSPKEQKYGYGVLTGSEKKNDSAGEGQQQFTLPTDSRETEKYDHESRGTRNQE